MMASFRIHSLIVADPESGRHARSWPRSTRSTSHAPAAGRAGTVGEIVSTDVVTIDSNAPLTQAARVMAEQGISHLVAVQPRTDRPVGVISASGPAAVLAWGG
jgi:CBS domain-containing protein